VGRLSGALFANVNKSTILKSDVWYICSKIAINMQVWNRAASIIKRQGGYARSKDLRAAGIHPSVLPAMERGGRVVRLRRGLYALPENKTRDERVEALLAVPGSVLCLGSALSYHELGTWEPPEIYLAVKSGRKVRIPDFPPIRVHHFSSRFFSLGLVERAGKGGYLRVYDVERTICDLFRFRRRLGTDVAATALREYVRRRSRNIPKLLDYSQQLRISGPVRQALEILV
jgi:predicted transcriptional regulator of viral defense system